MNKKVILYIATTLDGLIASKDGSVDWLERYNGTGEDYGYNDFYNSIDTVVVGNTTFEQFPNAYEDKECYVFSKTRKGKREHATYVNSSPKEFLNSLNDNNKIWLVGGANLAKQFLEAGLIDEFIITIMPTVLGEGISLFEDLRKDLSLKIKTTKSYDSGVSQIHYEKI